VHTPPTERQAVKSSSSPVVGRPPEPRPERVAVPLSYEAANLLATERDEIARVVQWVERAGPLVPDVAVGERPSVETAARTPLTVDFRE
jgi:hypothetical protein